MPTKTMGSILFVIGLIMVILSLFAILDLLKVIGTVERWFVFVSGVAVCVLGYYMARDRGDSDETTPHE